MSVPNIGKRVLQVPRGRHSASLETTRKISANVTFSPVLAGSVGYLNASKEWETGFLTTADKCAIPLILFQQSDDPDIQLPNSMTLSSESDAYVSGVDRGLDSDGNAAPKGPLMLIGLDAFIIESQNFQSEADLGDNYEPGECLTATNANANAVTGGRLVRTTAGSAYGAPVCGIVYEGVKTQLNGQTLLSWITYFLPRKS